LDYEIFRRQITGAETKENQPTMISKQAVYLDSERKRAVPEGHKDARFLLVREGHEVEEALVEKYDGAADLVNSAPKKRMEEPPPPKPPTLKGDVEPEKKAAAPAKPKPARKRAARKK
jgi:hypothetical protein